MDVYRRSRSQPRLPPQQSPGYRDYDTGIGGGASFVERRPLDRMHRSRSLENRRELFDDEYFIEYDDRFVDRQPMRHVTMPRRYESSQPSYLNVNTQPYAQQFQSRSPRSTYRDDTYIERPSPPLEMRRSSIQQSPLQQRDEDWEAIERSIRNYQRDTATMHPTARRYQHVSRSQGLSPLPSGHSMKPLGWSGDHFYRSGGSHFTTSSLKSPEGGGTQSLRMEPRVSTAQEEFEMRAGPAPVAGKGTLGPEAAPRSYSHHRSYQHESRSFGPSVMGGKSSSYAFDVASGGTVKRAVPPSFQRYHKVSCCCLSFRWPPWAYEEVEPPQPMYRHY
ncbi:hypothetical protein AB6A40_007139 [Gnathostoma spinigerum]|uniref:Uncharacterized protein n=1 Tax=Gnathostoma spinigerum TaxID=75299 RepID=A0ABD6EVZ8_9BILA